ncbi:uncharacterized protein LOC143027791 isoform X2 [Oratosquilla oratoria]|uniref:uncharacterized protein LOC143027791 isoform X2 n=1 Tax=Oratosquilla oratoria TaxID=337810 RepID=UPI003F7744DD
MKILNSKGYDGRTALQKAVLSGNLASVKLLIHLGADPNAVSDAGETAVHLGCGRGLLSVVVALLRNRGDPFLLDSSGRAAIHHAVQSGSLVLVQYLAEVWTVNLDHKDGRDITPLHVAAISGHLSIVKFLLQRKVDLCPCDVDGNSVLHAGARGGQSGICWAIVAAGGDHLLTHMNKEGMKPSQLAHKGVNVPPDCRKWLDHWTKQFEQKGRVETAFWPWVFQLVKPAVALHLVIILSVALVPRQEWLVGLPGFLVVLTIMARQHHRMRHPSGLANPIYLGAYGGGMFSTMLCYVLWLQAHFYIHPFITFAMWTVMFLHVMLFCKLVYGDPGVVKPQEPVKEVLCRVGDGTIRGYCIECQLTAPPLSHHCRLCCSCHHYTDHHCLFLNTCIAANNHWNFVIFIMTNVVLMIGFLWGAWIVVKQTVTTGSLDVSEMGWHLLEKDVWTMSLIICNIGSLLWAFSLLRYQFSVIGMQQTTLCRLKLGAPKADLTFCKRLRNVWSFLTRRHVPFIQQNYYFGQV